MKWFDFYGLINVGISYMYTSLMDPMGNEVIFFFGSADSAKLVFFNVICIQPGKQKRLLIQKMEV